MQTGAIQQLEIVFLLLLLFVAVFGYLADKFRQPYPIVLVIAGLLLSFIPGIPKITLNPDLVFFAILPPLLYAAAWLTSWREFSFNMVSILFLAFGLVGFTVFGVAMCAAWLFPGFDWRLGFVLGAVIATTDTLAAHYHCQTGRPSQSNRGYPGGRKPGQRCQWTGRLGIRYRSHCQ